MHDGNDALRQVVVLEDDFEVGVTGLWYSFGVGELDVVAGLFDVGGIGLRCDCLVGMIGLGYLVVMFVLRGGLLFDLAVNVGKASFRRRHVVLFVVGDETEPVNLLFTSSPAVCHSQLLPTRAIANCLGKPDYISLQPRQAEVSGQERRVSSQAIGK